MLISVTGSVAANDVSGNVLSGQQFEFLTRPSQIFIRATGSQAGLRMYFSIGGITIATEAAVPGTNRFPVVPDDNMLAASGAGGERLFLEFRNTAGTATTHQTVLEIV